MAQLAEAPFPPGDYPAVVVGSGPGGLQLSHSLRSLGVRHATISADPGPGGMFRRFPLFQRLLSWTKPFAAVEPGTRAYERYDWNSLVSDDPSLRGLMPGLMDGSSYFPSRPEMERNLATFAERAGVALRYGCRWTATRRDPDGRFVLETTEGEYRCRVAVFAVGVAEPWLPPNPGIEAAVHYGDTRPAEHYRGRRVFLIGKQNSGFEIANGILPWARQIILASPSPAKLSVTTRSLVGIRARYAQPYEDHVLAGGVLVLEAAIERIAREGGVYTVELRRTGGGEPMGFEVDDVIAATGFQAPLGDLPALGVGTFSQGRLPSLTPYWESATLPGIYFAGTIGQAAGGLKKHGIPSNSGAVQGLRYNAHILARHIAEKHFGVETERPRIPEADLGGYLLDEASAAPELWNQRSYLARVVSVGPDGALDDGFVPLAHFVDAPGPDAVAITVETDAAGTTRPAVYLRAAGRVVEHLLEPEPLDDFRGPVQRRQLDEVLAALG